MDIELNFRPTPEGILPLRIKYSGQHECQPAYLCIDGVNDRVYFYVSDNVGTPAYTPDEWNHRVLNVPVPGEIKGDCLQKLYEQAKPLIRRVWAGFWFENDAGRLDEDATVALGEVGTLFEADFDDPASVWCALLWAQHYDFREVHKDTTDVEISAIMDRLSDEAAEDGIILVDLHDLEVYVMELRDDLIREAAENEDQDEENACEKSMIFICTPV